MVRASARAGVAGAVLFVATPAFAHALGERYDVTIPPGFFVAGCIGVVVLTLGVSLLFVFANPHLEGERHIHPPDGLCPLAHSVRGYGVAMFALVLAAGLFGYDRPERNIAPALIWTVWWLGFGAACSLVADAWPLMNPWRTLFFLGERARYRHHWAHRPVRPYPARLAEWPAVLLLLAFLAFEFAAPFATQPFALALAILGYSALTFAGMAVFGRETWLRHGEAFSVLFAVLGRFAPVRINAAEGKRGHLTVRPLGEGLLADVPSTALTAFVLLLAAALLFDGILNTEPWRRLAPFAPGGAEGPVAPVLGLVALWLAFCAAYFLTCAAMRRSEGPVRARMRAFVFALIPIAVGYSIAHNYAYLLIHGQELLRLASDPFGRDWNLFGTAAREVDFKVLDPLQILYVMLGAILIGQTIAVWLAHAVAHRDTPNRAVAAQRILPLIVLMMIYSIVGLATLAGPLSAGTAPDENDAAWRRPRFAALIGHVCAPSPTLLVDADAPLRVRNRLAPSRTAIRLRSRA